MNGSVVNENVPETTCMLRQRYGMDSQEDRQFVYGQGANDVHKKDESVGIDDRIVKEKLYNKEQWRYMALVLDRFFFTVYFVLILVSLGTLFPWPTDEHRIAETNV